jgi:hypothetical protein
VSWASFTSQLKFLFSFFPPFVLKVLLNFEGCGELHGVSKVMAMARVEAVVKQKWMEHCMLLSL